MKPWAGLFGFVGVLAAFGGQKPPQKPWTVIVGGGVGGYLSPCGCTSPMSGGIRRWTSAVRARMAQGPTLVLENGRMVTGAGAQDRYKAEALAQALSEVKIAALNLTPSEARLGKGELSQISQLAGASFVATQLTPNAELGLASFAKHGPFLIGGAAQNPAELQQAGDSHGTAEQAAGELVQNATSQKLTPILMLDGDEDDAKQIAQAVPALKLIVYNQSGNPPYQATTLGNTMLATPGEKGKLLVQLTYSHGRFSGYSTEDLGPAVKDDPMVTKIYAAYLRGVDRANLLDSYPRVKTEPYAGAEKCASCHAQAYATWTASKHHGSLTDIQKQGHGADPDCVACHVTGLGSDQGYRTQLQTPNLAFVGCESCHGPGAAHSAHPDTIKMPLLGKQSCLSCHDTENSPNFDFLTYWKRIEHR